ncbi:MAG: inositol monophosphatase [Haloarculaceae archaeon]
MADAHRRAAMAERAARAGGAVARQSFRGELSVDTKADESLVTEADRAAQRQVVATVREEFPEDAVFAEEGVTPVGADGGGFVDSVPDEGDAWVVDPIDGTANYARGLAVWTTSVAATVDGEPVGTATYLPVLGDAYAAGPEGATRDGTRLSVSDRSDPGTFTVGLLDRWSQSQAGAFGEVSAALMRRAGDVRRFGTMQATLAFVADGGLDATVSLSPQAAFDSLAGAHLVREAGGVVTDLDGEPWTVDSECLVASNGEAHDAVVAAVREAADD